MYIDYRGIQLDSGENSYLVCLVSLVYFVSLVCLVEPDQRDELNKPDEPNKPDRPNQQKGPETTVEVSGPGSRARTCRSHLMPVLRMPHPSDPKTDQRDEASTEQGADYLQRPLGPTIHLGYCHKINRRFPVDNLERIAAIDNEQ